MGWLWVHADPFFTVVAYLAVMTFGIASLMVQSYALSCVFGTIAWSCFYHAFRSVIETQFPKTIVLVDPTDKAWSVAAAYTSFFHQFGVCFGFGLFFSGGSQPGHRLVARSNARGGLGPSASGTAHFFRYNGI